MVVASIGPGLIINILGLLDQKLEIISELWNNDIKAEMLYSEKAKPAK